VKWSRICLQGIGLLIVILICFKLDWGLFLNQLEGVSIPHIAVAVLLLIPFTGLKILRWNHLLRIIGVRYAPASMCRCYLASGGLSLVTPGRLGEFAKALYLHRDLGVPFWRGMSTVVVDRMFDVGFLFVSCFLFVQMYILPVIYVRVSQVAAIVTVVVALLLLVPPVRGWLLRIALRQSWFRRFAEGRRDLLQDMFDVLRHMTIRDSFLLLLFSIGSYLCLFLYAWVIGRGLGIQISFVEASFFIVVGNIATLLPISIGGLGPREQAMKELFTRILDHGQPLTPVLLKHLSAQAISFSLVYYFLMLLTLGAVGYLVWIRDPVPLQTLRALKQHNGAASKQAQM
jgi:uncharacterized protein (TIRG00374 family)